jgi:superoxide reductase
MKKNIRFQRCEKCGKMAGVIREGAGTLSCCGEAMTVLEPNTVDASAEKHVPVVEKNGAAVTVKVGSAAHPMTEEHYIEWIYLGGESCGQRRELSPGKSAEITFNVDCCDHFTVFAYCNLHGLWAAEV